MKQEVISAENSPNVYYNRRPLIRCEATYLGSSLPTKTSQPPGIIYEPLEKICEKETLPSFMSTSKKPVQLYLYHSGIIIELLFGKHKGELVWYPIQNLYCSAGILPFRTKHGMFEFRSLEDRAATKSLLKPLFSIVFREAVHKKVLQCHAFAVTSKDLAQLLVRATVVAYRDKNGWNQPINNLIFSSRQYNYTMNIVEEVHVDSGYSDHEESSQPSSQSPQSSIISTEIDVQETFDNHGPQTKGIPISIPSLTTDSQTTLVEGSETSIRCQSPMLSQFSDQSDMLGGCGASKDDDRNSVESSSISSGYPVSTNSSIPVPTQSQESSVSESVQRSHHNSDDPRGKRDSSLSRNDSVKNQFDSSLLRSYHSLSIKQSSIDKTPSKRKKTRVIPKLSIDGVHNSNQRRSILHQRPDIKPTTGYGEASYVPYHPDQFMYRGDRYTHQLLPSGVPDHHNTSKESIKKSMKASAPASSREKSGHVTRQTDNKMERKLTKKNIPRQLL